MLRPSALWTQIELTHLTGLCLPDSDIDFYVKISGSVSEELLPVHASHRTSLRNLGMSLFQRRENLSPGRRQLIYGDRVVYDSQVDIAKSEKRVPEVLKTLSDVS